MGSLSLSRLFVLSLVCAYEPLDSLFFYLIFLCMSFSGLYEKISSADLKSVKPGQTQNEVNFRHTIHRFSIHNFFSCLDLFQFSVRLCVGSDAKIHMLVSFQNYYHYYQTHCSTCCSLCLLCALDVGFLESPNQQKNKKKMNYACDNPIGLPYTSITN